VNAICVRVELGQLYVMYFAGCPKQLYHAIKGWSSSLQLAWKISCSTTSTPRWI